MEMKNCEILLIFLIFMFFVDSYDTCSIVYLPTPQFKLYNVLSVLII